MPEAMTTGPGLQVGPLRLGVLVSGRGSNLQSIMDAISEGRLAARVAVVVSNKAGAPALARARRAGIPAVFADPAACGSREDHDAAVVRVLREHDVELVVLAGYMRLLTPIFIEAFRHRVVNIHPSLLPAFTGLHAQRQALGCGVKVAGCTVHFVDEGLDSGPIILQAAVPVLEDDTEESLSARILAEEHRIYPEAIGLIAEGRVRVEGRRVLIRP